MKNKQRFQNSLRATISFMATIALATTMMLALTVVFTTQAHAQTFTVLHRFTGGSDGFGPLAGVVMDRGGNLYGTSAGGGMTPPQCNTLVQGCGTVWELMKHNSNWLLKPLYQFSGYPDGDEPNARVIIGPDGSLYGTTQYGGTGGCTYDSTLVGCGTIFNLRPPATFCPNVNCPWQETILHSFSETDAQQPTHEVVFDRDGNFYGTAQFGGTQNGGVVYKMTRSNGGWLYTAIYNFSSSQHNGYYPYAGLAFDQAGNLYGTTSSGGVGHGTVFELSPSGQGWTETVLYRFQGQSDGGGPAGVAVDASGAVYGTTADGGPPGSNGTAFKLTPSGGGWTFSVLSGLPCGDCFTGIGTGSQASPLLDSSGNIYGTTLGNGFGCGSVFKLVPSGGSYTYVSLHDFICQSGGDPYGNVISDGNGNLYSTTFNPGVVFEITP
jgi:uncharacterized repeat protein (TIGR03803 family)